MAIQGAGPREQLCTWTRALFSRTCSVIRAVSITRQPSTFPRIVFGIIVTSTALVSFLAQAQSVKYSYDAAGNLLYIEAGGAPTIAAVSPATVRQNSTETLQLTGTGLDFISVSASNPGIHVSVQNAGGTTATLGVVVDNGASLGTSTLTVTNQLGSASANLTVIAAQPIISLQPDPFAVPPDGQPHSAQIVFSAADVVDDTINLTVSDPTQATVTPATVTIPAGSTSASITITPQTGALGTSFLQTSSLTLTPQFLPIFIQSTSGGSLTAYSNVVGVVVSGGQSQNPSTPSRAWSRPVGVSIGAMITGISPNTMIIEGGHQPINVTGVALPAQLQVFFDNDSAHPIPLAVSNGTSTVIPLDSEPTNLINGLPKPGVHKLTFTDGNGNVIPLSNSSLQQFLFVGSGPTVFSIAPITAAAGSVQDISILGTALDYCQIVAIPMNSIAANNPTVSGDVTFSYPPTLKDLSGAQMMAPGEEQIQAQMQVLPSASGQYEIALLCPGGTWPTNFSLPSSAYSGYFTSSVSTSPPTTGGALAYYGPPPDTNPILTVVGATGGQTNPIAAPLVGVMVGTPPAPTASLPSFSPPVGLLVGQGALSMSPSTGIIGSTVSVTVTGQSLNSVTSIAVTPSAGVTPSVPSISGDGTTATFSLAIDPSAAEVPRRIDLKTATGTIPFAAASGAVFLVTAPPPVISSVSPDYVITNSGSETVTVSGQNLQGATAIQLVPGGSGLVAGAISSINSAGTTLTFSLNASSSAPLGPQAIVVVSPQGASSSSATAANTLTVGSSIGQTVSGLPSPVVGVIVGSTGAAPNPSIGPVVSPLVGVMIPTTSTQSGQAFSASSPVGVTVGPVVYSMSPKGIYAGETGTTLTILGYNLQSVNAITAVPFVNGVQFGSVTPSGDGTSATVSVSAQGASPVSGGLAVGLSSPSGRVPFVGLGTNQLQLIPSPTMSSVSPVITNPGNTYTLVIRGTGLSGVTSVVANPTNGISIPASPVWSQDNSSEILTVPLVIDGQAPLGPFVIQLVTPAGMTSTTGTAYNTITIQHSN